MQDIDDSINRVNDFLGDGPREFEKFADILWSIVINHMPLLKSEVESLLAEV